MYFYSSVYYSVIISIDPGFASFELKTSTKPVLGKWTIKAKTKKLEKQLQIKVEKYVLPKFQVTIEPESYVTYDAKFTTAKVCAKYVNGCFSLH